MLRKDKILKSLSAVVCAVVLLNGTVQAEEENVCATTDCIDATISDKVNYVEENTETGVDTNDLIKILEALKVNTEGFFVPLAQNLAGVFDTIIGVIKTVSTGGTISFDYSSIGPRIQLLVATAKNIAIASAKDPVNSIYYKEEHVLIKYGFGVTGVILDMINPYTTSGTITGDIAKLDRLLKEALATPNMTDKSVANTNVKEEFETLLRDCRNLVISKWTYLQDRPEFDDFKKQIGESTILRLDSVLRYGELKEAMGVLSESKTKMDDILKEIGYENIRSSVFDREELAKQLRSARTLKFTDFKNKAASVNLALEAEITRITGIRLDPTASMADIEKAKDDLSEAIEKAKNSNEHSEVLASKESKDELLRELHIARFFKFRITAKKGFDVNFELDKVILSLNWTSINVLATQEEVNNALHTIKEAMEKAEAAPDIL